VDCKFEKMSIGGSATPSSRDAVSCGFQIEPNLISETWPPEADKFLLAFGCRADQHQHAFGIVFHPRLQVDPVRPHVHVSPRREVALLPGVVIRLPLRRHPPRYAAFNQSSSPRFRLSSVLLAEKDYEPWLNAKAGKEVLHSAEEDALQKQPVSKRVNSSRAPDDDPTLIDPVGL